jgi:hypothetical protein
LESRSLKQCVGCRGILKKCVDLEFLCYWWFLWCWKLGSLWHCSLMCRICSIIRSSVGMETEVFRRAVKWHRGDWRRTLRGRHFLLLTECVSVLPLLSGWNSSHLHNYSHGTNCSGCCDTTWLNPEYIQRCYFLECHLSTYFSYFIEMNDAKMP